MDNTIYTSKDVLDYLKHQENKGERRQKRLFLFSLIIFIIIYIIGVLGFKILFNISWIESFQSASLMVSGLELYKKDTTTLGQRLFVILYSLIAVSLFIAIAGSVVAKAFDYYETL